MRNCEAAIRWKVAKGFMPDDYDQGELVGSLRKANPAGLATSGSAHPR